MQKCKVTLFHASFILIHLLTPLQGTLSQEISDNGIGTDPISSTPTPVKGTSSESRQEFESIIVPSSEVGDDALHTMVETSESEKPADRAAPRTETASPPKTESHTPTEQHNPLLNTILESLKSSGLLREEIRLILENNHTEDTHHVPSSMSLSCAILLYNETIDLPVRIKAAAEVNRAYDILIQEGGYIIKQLDEFEKTIARTIHIIDEVEGSMSNSVLEHVAGAFTYENFRLIYGAAAIRIQNLNEKATQASREGKIRKEALVTEAIKYEALRKCHNFTKNLLEKGGIHLGNPLKGTTPPSNAFKVINILQQLMGLFETLEESQQQDGLHIDKITADIANVITKNDAKLRFYENFLRKAKSDIDSRANQIIEVNNNLVALRFLNILSHVMIQNERIRQMLNKYDEFVRDHRRGVHHRSNSIDEDDDDEDEDDSEEDWDHDEL